MLMKQYIEQCKQCIFQMAASDKECLICPERNGLRDSSLVSGDSLVKAI
jgi:hypothetical protein